MAPTTTSISTSMLMATASYPPTAPPTPSSSFDGDEFSNNLFSDLAPLLTLFGEQVTKQFLSLSMGWADNILLAMGPLGIITTVVSAIRVGGKRGLKTLVGRARESISAAEAELLSSTSADVCEVWSGQEVVRQYGVPDTKEMIIVLDYDTSRVLGLVDACSKKYLREAPNQIVKDMQTYSSVALSELANGAPNITLNIRGSTVSKYELWFYTALGIVCQTVALVIPALGTYYWNWPKGDFPAPSYGYPCYAIGSGLIIAGLVFCSHIIEASTSEQDFIRNKPEPTMQVLRLQRACTVSDQHFGSYAIFNAPGDVCLRTSRLNNHRKGTTAAISSMMTIAGFICQFVGLRALHWSATIILLGATLVTTWARMSARRGLLLEPLCLPLPEGQEVPWLALFISRHLHLTSQQATGAFQSATQIRDDATPTRNEWEIVTGGYQANFKKSLARYAIAYNARNARSAYQGCSDLNEAIPPGVNPSADVVAACSRSNMATNLVNDKEAITLSVSMASDISKLMPIPKGSDNHVYQLSLAIETVTNLVAGPGLDLTAGPFTCFCWRHRASHKSTQSGRSVNGPSGSPASTQHTKILYAPYSFVVSRNLYSNNWKSDETCLRSVCSLWTHSLMSRRRLDTLESSALVTA
ncbi:hypothetical protein BU16DRAFT_325830 [Lophium mytilinum]|uniref:Uncharacterized protein n=1 Tax=Lophium mytilinum TaxID=390894 RepID=A0A6A6R1I8_9PEZI|nr:hypothetical protein BU16DRAFT_325830 [Lophium mytilinum]